MQAVGQGDFIIDRVYAAVMKLQALLTSRTPKYYIVGREDSDNKLATVWRGIMEYIWDISEGDVQLKQAIYDYATAGCGYLYAYVDPDADYGRGEVKFTYVDPFRVYVDPAIRNRFHDDGDQILSTILTRKQLLRLYPQLEELIDDIAPFSHEEDYPSSGRKNSSESFTPAEVQESLSGDGTKYRILERFTTIEVPFFRLFDTTSGTERIVDQGTFERIGQESPELFQNGVFQFVRVMQPRVHVIASIGHHLLYEQTLNTDVSPLVPLPNLWTNTAYPKSDTTKVKDSQRLLNKLFSLALSHAQSSAGLKLLLPEGSVDDISQLERDWANPNAVILYNPEAGEPHFPSPTPLAAEFYHLIERVEHYIDLNFGIPELLQGFSPPGEQPFKTTQLLNQQGESKGKSKLRDIEAALNRLGRAVYNLAKGHYTFAKKMSIVQPNNSITEIAINQRLYDDKTNELMAIENDITIGQHDVRMQSGSTLPSNRLEEYQLYLEAYKLNLIDDVEVLKKTDIFDKEGVLERKGTIQNMGRTIEALQAKVKELEGDLQTAQREKVHAEQKVVIKRFESDLYKMLSDIRADAEVDQGKLQLLMEQLKKQESELQKEEKKAKGMTVDGQSKTNSGSASAGTSA